MSNTTPPTAAEPPKTPLPEITLRVIVLGIILSVVMGAANVYVGLKAGMTVSSKDPATTEIHPMAHARSLPAARPIKGEVAFIGADGVLRGEVAKFEG
eukprot:COSAG02_NODE_18011_length_966_cov_1.077278_1_plen_97_part_01